MLMTAVERRNQKDVQVGSSRNFKLQANFGSPHTKESVHGTHGYAIMPCKEGPTSSVAAASSCHALCCMHWQRYNVLLCMNDC